MSMLTRKGTLVSAKRSSLKSLGSRRSSSRRSRSSSSGSIHSSAHKRSHAEEAAAGARLKNSHRHNSGSPMTSLTETTVSFDDERKLVRTSVGWDSRYGDDLQPEYGAFMYQINEASKEADNILDFVCKTSNIICNTIFVTVIVGLSMALPIAMVSIGVKYLDECPREPRIPVYLLVGGCFGMIKLLSTLWRNIQSRRYSDAEVVFDDHDADGAFASTTYRTMDTILLLFLVGWQVAGTYWSLEIWTPHFHQLLHEPSNWCDRTVYMFSIYQIFGCYGLMALYISVLLFITCCQKCRRQF